MGQSRTIDGSVVRSVDQLKSHLWFAIWVSLIIVVVVPWGTLQSDPRWERMEWIPFVSPPVEFLDMVGNVLFYIPFGILCGFEVADARKPVALVTGCAALLSISTELSQVFSVTTYPSMTDVACNVLGAIIGALLATRRTRPRETTVPVDESP